MIVDRVPVPKFKDGKVVGGQWCIKPQQKILELRKAGRKAHADWLWERCAQYEQNPFSCFLPHGVAWHKGPKSYADGEIILPPSTYDKKYRNDGYGFISDDENDYVFLLAPRKTGKSAHGVIFVARRALKCDPNWPIFTEHGVKPPPPWTGPKRVVISSFSWQNTAELWKVYQEFLPKDELGPYAAGGKKGNPGFGDGRPKYMTMQKSGTEFIFLNYNQRLQVWSNFAADMLHADEQIPLAMLRAWEAGTRTMGDYTPACFTLSGFVLPERPDTGMVGELKRTLWDGKKTGGRIIARYNLDVPSTPDAIATPKKKKESYDHYANPAIERSEKVRRQGLAYHFPGWEPGGGMVFDADVWQRNHHVIDPLWEDNKTPKTWTKARVIDYADRRVSCCGWWAMGPVINVNTGKREIVTVLYRLLYEFNMLIAEFVQEIVKQSHNTRTDSKYAPPEEITGNILAYHDEVCTGEEFYFDIMDSRAASWRQQGEVVLDIFRRYGLNNIRQAEGKENYVLIPNMKDEMRIDRSKPHPFKKGVMGASRVYYFDLPCIMLGLDEFDGMDTNEDKPKEFLNMKRPHDFIDMHKYFCAEGLSYWGPSENWNNESECDETGPRNPVTGY